MILFLHGMNYNFFNISKLTYPEINSLVSAKNRKVKKEEQLARRARRKSKMKKR